MLIVKILYIILIIIAALFYLLYIDNLSVLLLIFVIALPLFMGAALLIFKLSAKAWIDAKDKQVIKKNKFTFSVIVENRSIFTFPCAVLTVEYGNKLNNSLETITINVPIHAMGKEKVEIGFSSDYCGIAEARIRSFRVYDYLKLFSCRVKHGGPVQVYVMPEVHEIRSDYGMKNTAAEESNVYSQSKSGDDPAEIFDLKDYAYGDKLSRIHWNLSLRQDKLITRHYSQPVSSSVLVAVEYMRPDTPSGFEVLDALTETAASVSEFLIGIGTSHDFLFYNRQIMNFEPHEISETSELSDVILKMYRAGAYTDGVKLSDRIAENADSYARIVYITPFDNSEELDFVGENGESVISAVIVLSGEQSEKYSENPYYSIVRTDRTGESINQIIF